jgi:hypothetical protein
MSDLYEQRRSNLDGYVEAFKPVARQVGAVFAIDGRVAGVELYDCEKTFAKFLRKLVGSYALDAIESADRPAAAAKPADARAFLARVQAAAVEGFPSTDLGKDLRFTGEDVAGGALLYEGRVVHLGAFSNASRQSA